MANLELVNDDSLPLRDLVYQSLRNAILNGELAPGERLMEVKLAGRLGVSRTPVREAIRLLEQEGLAVTIPQRGARVAKLSRKEMEDIYELRRCLEQLAVNDVSGKLTPGQVADMRYASKVFEEAVADGDVSEIEQKDWEFHAVIYEATGNRHLVSVMLTLQEQLGRFRWARLQNKTSFQKLIQEHHRIVDALEKEGPEESLEAVRVHLDTHEELLKLALRKNE